VAATFVLWGERDRLLALKAVQRAPIGQQVRISKRDRSVEQNRLLHGCLGDISDQLPWPKEYGELHDLIWWKRRLSLQWMIDAKLEVEVVESLEGEEVGLFLPHTSDLTVEQYTSLIEFVFSFGATRGVVFKEKKPDNGPEPPPREYDQ